MTLLTFEFFASLRLCVNFLIDLQKSEKRNFKPRKRGSYFVLPRLRVGLTIHRVLAEKTRIIRAEKHSGPSRDPLTQILRSSSYR